VNIIYVLSISIYKNEYIIFKPVETTIRGDYGKKNKNRGNEPVQVIVHIYIEMSQGNSQCSYLKQTKMSFFLLQNQRIQCLCYQVLPREGGWYHWEGRGGRRRAWEDEYSDNTVYTYM
jgi:hypothetical protein